MGDTPLPAGCPEGPLMVLALMALTVVLYLVVAYLVAKARGLE